MKKSLCDVNQHIQFFRPKTRSNPLNRVDEKNVTVVNLDILGPGTPTEEKKLIVCISINGLY